MTKSLFRAHFHVINKTLKEKLRFTSKKNFHKLIIIKSSYERRRSYMHKTKPALYILSILFCLTRISPVERGLSYI